MTVTFTTKPVHVVTRAARLDREVAACVRGTRDTQSGIVFTKREWNNHEYES